jgi:hypothetical protein
MTEHGLWVSYGGAARPALAAILLAAAIALVYAGLRLPLPAALPRPGRRAAAFLVVTWVIALAAFLTGFVIYAEQLQRKHLLHGLPSDHILPVTLCAAGVTFFLIAVNAKDGGRTAFTGALIGAMAGPMIFEPAFDLIVMTRTYPPVPPDPALYRVIFFAPLFLLEFATLALLTLSPMVRISRATFFALALMLAVWAAWAVAGFGYPSSALPFTLNVVSKLIAFAAVLTLFLPQRARADGIAAGDEQVTPLLG